jgi:hypothetical protein
MTSEEILEAEKAIADMRNVLTVLTGTTDADKLVPLVLEKASLIIHTIEQILHGRSIVSGPDRDRLYYPLQIMWSLAEMAERRLDYKAKLLDAVAKQVPIMGGEHGQDRPVAQEDGGDLIYLTGVDDIDMMIEKITQYSYSSSFGDRPRNSPFMTDEEMTKAHETLRRLDHLFLFSQGICHRRIRRERQKQPQALPQSNS